jgi:hypothetical protein
MPRGVPKSGFRNRKSSAKAVAIANNVVEFHAPVKTETDAEIDARISERFEVLEVLTNEAITGDVRALIVSGPAGLGKSFTVEEVLYNWDPNAINHTFIKGYVRATGLYKLLYQHRGKGQVLVFDDADSILYDDVSLNMIKAVTDSGKTRRVSYLAEGNMIDEDSAERLPKTFEFEGTIIFITNLDMNGLIDKGHKLAPHLAALVSRAFYIDLAMKTKHDYMVRIRQVLKKGLLTNMGLNSQAQDEVINFIDVNRDTMRELSLRMALKVATVRKMNSENWEKIARITTVR